MTVLMDAERSFKQVMDSATGHFPHESRARMISERMRIWLRAAISDMVDNVNATMFDRYLPFSCPLRYFRY